MLSSYGYDAYGLDTSDLALEAARKTEEEMGGKGVYETRPGITKGSVNWLKGDFFKSGFAAGVDGTFDFIYDYTVSPSFYSSGSELKMHSSSLLSHLHSDQHGRNATLSYFR